MKIDRLWRVAAPMILVLAGCGGAGDDRAAVGDDSTPAAIQPPAGVPAGTRPLPLPEIGVAYNNPQPRENVRDGGTLTLPIGSLGPNWNLSHVERTADVSRVLNWLAPRLWNYSVTGEVSPNEDYLLSAELLGTDPQQVKYTLNPNAKWNDGTPIDWTAFDTAWKTQRGEDTRFAPASTVGFSSIANVEKGELDNEVIVTFDEPFYPFEMVFQHLLHPKNLDPEFFRRGWINNLNPELLGGPFTVESLTEQRLVLVRNPLWWGETPKLERVIYRQMEPSASINAFQNGEIDATSVETADRLEQIRRMNDVQVRRGFNIRTSVYTMGRDSALFQDEAARRAFVLGTDRQLLARIRFQGLNWEEEAPGSALVFPFQTGYRDNIADLHYDPEEARAVLEEAGWILGNDGYRYKDGRIAEFTYVTFGDDPTIHALARAQQEMARQIGLKMTIDTRRSADFGRTMGNGDFDVVIMAWSASDPFGYVWACQIYCSDSESNFSRLGNEALDERLRAPGRVADIETAMALANDAEAEALHLYGTFPLFNGPEQLAVRAGLANYGPAGFVIPNAPDVGWEKGSGD